MLARTEEKSEVNLKVISLQVRCSFIWLLSELYLWLSMAWKLIVLGILGFDWWLLFLFYINPTDGLWASWIYGLMSDINLGNFSSIIVWNISYGLFSFSSTSQVNSVTQAWSDFWTSCGLQYSRLPCPSPIPEAYSNSCPCISDAI